jgi:hypothetical protein
MEGIELLSRISTRLPVIFTMAQRSPSVIYVSGLNRTPIGFLLATLAGILVFSALLLPTGEAAEIGLSRKELAGTAPPLTVVAVIISGQIENGDAKKVETLLSEIKQTDNGHQIRRLLIHSPGGLAGEAMEIGKLLRANSVEVFIPRELTCISACVLILAGGATRTIDGQVGIDHPHFLRAVGPGDDVPALLAETKKVMRNYFRSMGVAENLADAMFSLPNGTVHYLSQDELSQYQLKSSHKVIH